MIKVRNTQRKISVDLDVFRKQVGAVKRTLGRNEYCVGYWLASDRTLQRFNKEYRGINKPTDALSFRADIPYDLGDVLIGVQYIARRAEHYRVPVSHVLPLVVVHSLCHLAGHDHDHPGSEEKMHEAEGKALADLKELGLYHGEGIEDIYSTY
ncbi:hypothetical protein NDN08_001708 [Rhodosorus marinus]|uniref:Uncharacterized protein n=1 Tax=Rhodosorus marinus TaxID=101924 RepID=A0AAV8UT15_9RHOD|nr:hypothetical protein NDN08_001708 [Rhodosorus marinus]